MPKNISTNPLNMRVHLFTGAYATLSDLNEHDLRQHCMFQMDMLRQLRDVASSLGLDALNNDSPLNYGMVMSRPKEYSPGYPAPLTQGNILPTRYKTNNDWQRSSCPRKTLEQCPTVDAMTSPELQKRIVKQDTQLSNFKIMTSALHHLGLRISDSTQPPKFEHP